MKRTWWIVCGALYLHGLSPAAPVEKLPAELFAAEPRISRMQMSPTGRYYSYLVETKKGPTFFVRDNATGKNTSFRMPDIAFWQTGRQRTSVAEYYWVTDDRILYVAGMMRHYWLGAGAGNCDGRHAH